MNIMTTTSSQYKDLSDFLSKHTTSYLKNNGSSNEKNELEITHTRIKSEAHNVYGAAYHIDKDELTTLYNLLYN